MNHDKILKRPDGSRVKITVFFQCDWSYTKPVWDFKVHVCAAGKRTWKPSIDGDSYAIRKLLFGERQLAIRNAGLGFVTEAEVFEVMLELWRKLEPVGIPGSAEED